MLNASGIGTVIKNLLPYLAKDPNLRLSLLYLKKDEETLLQFPGCNLILMKHPIYTMGEQFEFFWKIPRCDLFWSPHYNIPLFPIRAKKRLVQIHDVIPLAYFSSLSLMQKIYAKIFFNAAVWISDIVTTVSQFSSTEIQKYCYSTKPITWIANSLGTQFLQKVENKEWVRKKHRLPYRFLLYVGNLKPHKNIHRLLQAYRQLKPSIDLVILGEGKSDFALSVQKDSFLRQHVHFTGYVEDREIPAIYGMATLCLFPSLYEGFGYPPLEAMAVGCPVIASNVASIPEVCQDAVEYVDPTSTDSIAQAIALLLNDSQRREELIEKGKERVRHFMPEKSAKQYIQLIHENCSCS
ncbi:MAG: glycosyltransferase family 4 protein [Chlamydiales bacterium]